MEYLAVLKKKLGTTTSEHAPRVIAVEREMRKLAPVPSKEDVEAKIERHVEHQMKMEAGIQRHFAQREKKSKVKSAPERSNTEPVKRLTETEIRAREEGKALRMKLAKEAGTLGNEYHRGKAPPHLLQPLAPPKNTSGSEYGRQME